MYQYSFKHKVSKSRPTTLLNSVVTGRWIHELDQAHRIVSAELPEVNNDYTFFKAAKTHMIFGPCGKLNPNTH